MSAWHSTNGSLKGINREENKDRVWIQSNDNGFIAVLFDGISSANEANQGIDIAINFLQENFSRLNDNNFTLADLMYETNEKILLSGLKSPFATYSAIYIPAGSEIAQFSNLGDSRIYEVTPQYLKQLSKDDNLIHNKNVVTKYLGMLNLTREQVDGFPLSIEGKRILLCSDGFYSMLESRLSRFYEVLNFKNGSNIQRSLAAEIEGKNSDDASYVLIFK